MNVVKISSLPIGKAFSKVKDAGKETQEIMKGVFTYKGIEESKFVFFRAKKRRFYIVRKDIDVTTDF